jgi:DNA-binding transcriptional regulator YdaS (Cro superfamily)
MNKVQKFSLLCGSVSSMLNGGKSELADMLGVRLDHLSKMLNGKKGITDQRIARMEEIAAEVLPPGFGFQGQRITDLSEIWSKETIVIAEAAAKMRGMTLEQYVQTVAREDLRPILEGKLNRTQPTNENESLERKEDSNQSH